MHRLNRKSSLSPFPKKPHYLKHRTRLRERFEKSGVGAMHDYESLELLLTYVIPRRDVKLLAKNLIERFGSLSGVIDANPRELESVKGIGPRSALLIPLIKELCTEYMAEKMISRDLLSSPRAVVDFARMKLAALPHEDFMVIFLNVKNEVINYETIHEGTVDRAVVYPRKIVESALAHHAVGLILVHNHPSGHPEPSAEDKSITNSIAEACRTMDIRILDHIVVGREGYFSFTEHNLI
jgi:DNA repair protein RadC